MFEANSDFMDCKTDLFSVCKKFSNLKQVEILMATYFGNVPSLHFQNWEFDGMAFVSAFPQARHVTTVPEDCWVGQPW